MMLKRFQVEKYWPHLRIIETGIVELKSPIDSNFVVYAQVMQDGSGSLWIPERTIKLTLEESLKNQYPGNMSDANWGIFKFDFNESVARG